MATTQVTEHYVIQINTRNTGWVDASYAPFVLYTEAERVRTGCFDLADSRVVRRTVTDELI